MPRSVLWHLCLQNASLSPSASRVCFIGESNKVSVGVRFLSDRRRVAKNTLANGRSIFELTASIPNSPIWPEKFVLSTILSRASIILWRQGRLWSISLGDRPRISLEGNIKGMIRSGPLL